MSPEHTNSNSQDLAKWHLATSCFPRSRDIRQSAGLGGHPPFRISDGTGDFNRGHVVLWEVEEKLKEPRGLPGRGEVRHAEHGEGLGL